MAITISGTTGVAGVDGSATAPATAGTDSNSGIYYGADVIKFSTGGTERMSITNTGFTGISEGKILQVVTTYKSDEYSNTGGWNDVTGMTIAITPSATSSKILFQESCDYAGGVYVSVKFQFKIASGSYADLALPTAAGNRTAAHHRHSCYNNESDKGPTGWSYLHSPNTTDEVTYKMQMNGTGRLNYPGNGGNSASYTQGSSSLFAWEIAG